MYRTLARYSRYLAHGSVEAELYDLGDYPGIVLSPGRQSRALGEVYALNSKRTDEIWPVLDAYEGCGANDPEPHEYRRERVQVTLSGGSKLDAWAYVLQHVPETAVRVLGGDYLAWRRQRA
jgi:gamma-glutamylcyclotransferase (GGCT)/AIG2-like uncharacterized protein YtfP